MTLIKKLIALLLLRTVTSVGLYETCYQVEEYKTFVGYCDFLSDCTHLQHEQNTSLIRVCDDLYVCCFPPPPDTEIPREIHYVLGGIRTYRNEFPHMALIGYDGVEEGENQWHCSGSLITELFILSAAHCNTESASNIALIGATDYVKDYESSEVRSIIEIIDHPDYDFNERIHDICLYRLNASIVMTNNIKIICLPDQGFTYDLVATGWGATSLTSGMSQILLKMPLEQWDSKKCNMKYNESIQICAGSDQPIDTCSGDSGGPIQVKSTISMSAPCSYTILGITSHGKACFQRNGTTSIYTRVSSYLRWIKEIVWHGTMDCDLN